MNEKIINWINEKLQEISKDLIDALDENAASFRCGKLYGYREALLELQFLLEYEDH